MLYRLVAKIDHNFGNGRTVKRGEPLPKEYADTLNIERSVQLGRVMLVAVDSTVGEVPPELNRPLPLPQALPLEVPKQKTKPEPAPTSKRARR